MTAITTRRIDATGCAMLRFAMRVDATATAFLGLLVAFAADPVSRLTGLTPTQEWFTGAALVAYGAIVYALAAVADLRMPGAIVIAGNVALTVALVAILVTDAVALTPFGAALMLSTAVGTALMAWLQYLGVRRLAVNGRFNTAA